MLDNKSEKELSPLEKNTKQKLKLQKMIESRK